MPPRSSLWKARRECAVSARACDVKLRPQHANSSPCPHAACSRGCMLITTWSLVRTFMVYCCVFILLNWVYSLRRRTISNRSAHSDKSGCRCARHSRHMPQRTSVCTHRAINLMQQQCQGTGQDAGQESTGGDGGKNMSELALFSEPCRAAPTPPLHPLSVPLPHDTHIHVAAVLRYVGCPGVTLCQAVLVHVAAHTMHLRCTPHSAAQHHARLH
jgi:hypothetical protein